MALLALILYSLVMLGYAALLWAIAYHVYSYTAPGDITRSLFIGFILLSLMLAGGSLYYFLQVPWNALVDIPLRF